MDKIERKVIFGVDLTGANPALFAALAKAQGAMGSAKKGSVYRHFGIGNTIACGVEFAHHGVDKNHRNNGFQDVIHRMVNSPGIKGTEEAKTLSAKHLS